METPSNSPTAIHEQLNHSRALANDNLEKTSHRKSYLQNDAPRSDDEKSASTRKNNTSNNRTKYTDDTTTQKSADDTSVDCVCRQVSHGQRQTTQLCKKHSSSTHNTSQTSKDCDQAAKRIANLTPSTSAQSVTTRRSSDRSCSTLSDYIETHSEELDITPKTATLRSRKRSASKKQKSSNRTQRSLACKAHTQIENTLERKECDAMEHKRLIKVTRSLRSSNFNLDEDSGMDVSDDSGPEIVVKETPKNKHTNANSRRVTRRSTGKRSDVKVHTNTPLTAHFSSPEREAEEVPRSKQRRTNTRQVTRKSAEAFAVNGDSPLSESHSLKEIVVDTTPRSKQANTNITRKAAETLMENGDTPSSQCFSSPERETVATPRSTLKNRRGVTQKSAASKANSSLSKDDYSSPEKTAHKSSCNRRKSTKQRSKSEAACCCGYIPYVDSRSVLQVLNSDMVCSYHRHLGRALSTHLAQV